MKWLKRILISLVVIIACVFIGAYIWLNSSKPTYEGELKLSGLQDQVDVYFDDYGVPHIYGASTAAVFYGYGYAQAQSHGDEILRLYYLTREQFLKIISTGDIFIITQATGDDK